MTTHRRSRMDVQLAAAVGLLEAYAELLPVAVHHLQRELVVLDGYASSTTGRSDPTPPGTSEMTSVERAADARLRLTSAVDQIRDDRDAILSLISSALHICRQAIGERAPVPATRCADALHGREGAIEWGRPDCEELPSKAGLCGACYFRERRWRESHGKAGRDLQPVH
jgi:hypothetical protein